MAGVPADYIAELVVIIGVVHAHEKQLRRAVAVEIVDRGAASVRAVADARNRHSRAPAVGSAGRIKVPAHPVAELVITLRVVYAHEHHVERAVIVYIRNCGAAAGVKTPDPVHVSDVAPASGGAVGVQVPADTVAELVLVGRVVDAHEEQVRRAVAVDIGDIGPAAGRIYADAAADLDNIAPATGFSVGLEVPADPIAEMVLVGGVVDSHQYKVGFRVVVDISDSRAAAGGAAADAAYRDDAAPPAGTGRAVQVPANHVLELILAFRVVDAHQKEVGYAVFVYIGNSRVPAVVTLAQARRRLRIPGGQVNIVGTAAYYPDETRLNIVVVGEGVIFGGRKEHAPLEHDDIRIVLRR